MQITFNQPSNGGGIRLNLKTLDLSGIDVSDRAHGVCFSAERLGACPPMPLSVSKDAPGPCSDYATLSADTCT